MGNSSDEEFEAGKTGDLYSIGRSTKSSNQAVVLWQRQDWAYPFWPYLYLSVFAIVMLY